MLSALRKLEQSLADTISVNVGDLGKAISFRTRAEPILNLEIFDAHFKEMSKEQLQQLPFLHGELQRPLAPAHSFTSEGRKLLDDVLSR